MHTCRMLFVFLIMYLPSFEDLPTHLGGMMGTRIMQGKDKNK